MATRHELNKALNDVENELWAIVRKHALNVPDCAVEEIAVYFVTKEIPRLDDWSLDGK